MHSHMFHPVHKVLKANNIFSGSRQAIVHKLKVFNTAVTRTAVLPDGAALCAEDVVSVVNLVLRTGRKRGRRKNGLQIHWSTIDYQPASKSF